MDAPSISVVTPVLNGRRFLERTIRSVIEQDYRPVEYFIQDGGSTDGTLDIIKRYEFQLTAWASQPDDGQTEAITSALLRTTGDILAWINADDFYEPDAFAHVAEVFAENPDSSAVAGAAWLMYPDNTRTLRRPLDVTHSGLLNWRRNWIPQPGVFFRRSAWQQVGPLDRSLQWAMDFDLWLRLLDAGPIVTTDRVLASFRQHPDAKCFTDEPHMYAEARRVILRHASYRELGVLFTDAHVELTRQDRLCAQLLADHVRRRWSELKGDVVLFGAGAHTPWLLGVIDGRPGPNITAILDDNAQPGTDIRGIPVVRPTDVNPAPGTIVLSTDTVAETLTVRCRELFDGRTRVVNLYESLDPGPYPKSDTHRAAWM
jgi:glycosyltransferase involved in cell wall biosynthesis